MQSILCTEFRKNCCQMISLLSYILTATISLLMNAIEKSALSRLDEFVTSRDKFQFIEQFSGVLFTVLTYIYTYFYCSFATKNALLSCDKGALFEWCLPAANDDGFAEWWTLKRMMCACGHIGANIASLRNEVEQHHICEANASYRRKAMHHLKYIRLDLSLKMWYNKLTDK